MTVIDDVACLESEVRVYSRSWPDIFTRASGDRIHAADGSVYLDFFMGAGALNYGHANPLLKAPLIDYLTADGIVHSLDMMTEAKSDFLRSFQELVLRPRHLDYKVQFTGPTGTNAVEAALKLARKVTGRETVVAFTRSFHGVSLGALAVTANADKRAGAGVPLDHVLRIPYDGFGQHGVSGLDLLDDLIRDTGSGISLPAAVIVETVQGEGGVNIAGAEWLQRLAAMCSKWDILLVVDDIQAGCGRTGGFFSFEDAGILPDIVCLSKSISGYGLPMALTLFRRELDVWNPGEHNGTFRGSNPAFVTATAALRTYWSDEVLHKEVVAKGELVSDYLTAVCSRYPGVVHRGRGLFWGVEFAEPGLARRVSAAAYEDGLLVETSGPDDEVVKLLPSLLISPADLRAGLRILGGAIDRTMA
ncbi:diaminobutyrate--2-oxoglutarate transaminase [Kribbella albertanoniae]|uniref:Diaminobutyrate--2-oxoglutarate transaminase n=1 Tax=Kribbella albertanoniae TaxID=1266829 RepID=A0A4R4QF85_9ACTN|nr:diaminobutyrate--2-oxoglutarate transaminase [Kribbella albertanoniae]TDC34174.1 diaminobutyrate--2-oxoglutarate transaminase [Kribbella albertanoniae]